MPDKVDWRAMSRPELDRGLNNSQAVADSAGLVAGWDERSDRIRAAHAWHADLPYGPLPRNRIDLLPVDPAAPTLLFVHGGYFQSRSRQTFAFLADGPRSLGLNFALAGYTLAPDITLRGIVAEIDAAIDQMPALLTAHGLRADAILLAGWSAGAHLAASMLAHRHVRGVLAISGIYDVEPLCHSYLNDKLKLHPNEAPALSPLRCDPFTTAPLALAVGGNELPLLREQTLTYAATRRAQGHDDEVLDLPGCNHFTILDALADPDGALTAALGRLVAGALRNSEQRDFA